MARAKKEDSVAATDDGQVAARVLVACTIEGVAYRPDDVAERSAPIIAAAKEAGLVDDHPDAVAYVRGLSAGSAE